MLTANSLIIRMPFQHLFYNTEQCWFVYRLLDRPLSIPPNICQSKANIGTTTWLGMSDTSLSVNWEILSNATKLWHQSLTSWLNLVTKSCNHTYTNTNSFWYHLVNFSSTLSTSSPKITTIQTPHSWPVCVSLTCINAWVVNYRNTLLYRYILK